MKEEIIATPLKDDTFAVGYGNKTTVVRERKTEFD